jgi:tetratricopeptide (TPR) repeat protein
MRLCHLVKNKKIIIFFFIFFIVLQISTSAEGTYNSYNYDVWKNSVPSAAGYLPYQIITGNTLGVGQLTNPKDLYVRNNLIYLLDSGNNRIIILDSDFKIVKIIVPTNSKSIIRFKDAEGIFVDTNLNIYVADTSAKTVYIMDNNGVVKANIDRPSSNILPPGFNYQPTKVIIDSAGIVYIVSKGSYSGALQFDSNYNFLGFYGNERVAVTLDVLRKQFLRNFMTLSQKDSTERFVPNTFTNFDIDAQDFIYTCSNNTDKKGQVKKLNPLGDNILWYQSYGNMQQYGDLESYYDNQVGEIDTVISDVKVDNNGFIDILDTTYDRIFQYDQNSNLLFVFGGKSNQVGCLNQPVAIESINDKIIVLDSTNGDLTIYKETPYCTEVHKAVLLFNDGKYNETLNLWKNVIKYDSNFTVANIGLGKALEKTGQYQKSLNYFKAANDKADYSECYSLYRSIVLSEYFNVILVIIILLSVILFLIFFIRKKSKKNDFLTEISKNKYPFYTMMHPFKGFDYLKQEKKTSLLFANLIVILFFVVQIISRQNTGFLFNPNKISDFNLLLMIVTTFGFFVLWVVNNWALCTLFEGKGSFKEIWIFSAYAMLPFVILMIPVIVLSNIFVTEEAAFMNFANFIVYGWTGICLFMAIKEVHQYSFKKTIAVIFATLLGMCLTVLLFSIIYSVVMQFVGFVSDIVNEMIMRW